MCYACGPVKRSRGYLGALKILLSLEPGSLFHPGDPLGAPKSVLPPKPEPLLRSRGSTLRPAKDRSRVAKTGQGSTQEAPKRPQETAKRLQRSRQEAPRAPQGVPRGSRKPQEAGFLSPAAYTRPRRPRAFLRGGQENSRMEWYRFASKPKDL